MARTRGSNLHRRLLARARGRRSGDIVITLTAATLFGVLMTAAGVMAVSGRSPFAIFGAKRTATAQPSPDAVAALEALEAARRTGSIIVVLDRKMCEELRFDNVTGRFLSIDKVECDARLSPDNDVEAQAEAKRARAMSVLASFKK